MSAHKKLLLITLILIATLSCSVSKKNKEYIGIDEVAFIEFYQTQEGEVISGIAPHGRRIDGPTYRFDASTKKLDILRKFDFSIDSVKVLLGNGKILKGAAGSGLSMRLTPIYRFPFSSNNLTIIALNSEGLQLTFEQKELLLQEGQEWSTKTVKMDTIQMESPTIIKTTTTYSIRYHGKINKREIVE